MQRTILAIDPGRGKCGLALGRPGAILARAVVPTERLAETVADWVRRSSPARVVMGAQTGGVEVRRALDGVTGLPPIEVVDEAGTTLEARRRYFDDHPPRGWRRLVPRSLQVPPTPYDDYVAVLLLERAAEAESPPP